ncbi:unnamed protein product [Darwinula stevensoni]|uniref:PH domain-containing protein n=1 Tax=Darwinula stevensoni TaxID=69355 RepID=A0A7R9A2W7_9CRUS|nr:unnamed protein product [Darwinula stevensoni]CAG0890559.1 unnamed protein product [Darwinula stevensoni]
MSDQISEGSTNEQLCIATKIQHHGFLLKKSFRRQADKWQRRYFVVKDSFLLYYGESERKNFEKRGHFNIHPRGVIPIGGCIIHGASSIYPPSSQDYVITISSDEYQKVASNPPYGYESIVTLAAATKNEMDKWIQALKEATRITWNNSQLAESLMRELETQGLQLNQEKQTYVERLQKESQNLQEELDKNLELEKLNAALNSEKKKLEAAIDQLQREHIRLQGDYKDTLTAIHLVEEDRTALQSTTEFLQESLEELAQERERILEDLKASEDEKSRLHEATRDLQSCLHIIEEETQLLLREKSDIQQRFVENELRAKLLEEEKSVICQQSDELLSSINDLVVQQSATEAELREEVAARLEAEKRLGSALQSLSSLEKSLRATTLSDTIKEEIMPNVRELRRFFEEIAMESQMEASRPGVLRSAIMARKVSLQKKKEQKFLEDREKRTQTLRLPSSGKGVRRSLSTLIACNTLRREPKIPRRFQTMRPLRSGNKDIRPSLQAYVDGNGYLDERDFACLALRTTVLEGKGDFSHIKWEENFHIMMNLWAEMAELADLNKDGRVTAEEFAEVVKNICIGKRFHEFPQALKMFVDSRFKTIDLNDDGVIDLSEFRIDCVQRMAYEFIEEIDDAFEAISSEDDKRRGGITLSRYQELYAEFVGNPDDDCEAVMLFGPLPLVPPH